MKREQAMISMIFQLIPNTPGNYPEVAMSGKNYTIGEMVYYNEQDRIEISRLLKSNLIYWEKGY